MVSICLGFVGISLWNRRAGMKLSIKFYALNNKLQKDVPFY